MLAGRITKPDRSELRQMAKAFRRAERVQAAGRGSRGARSRPGCACSGAAKPMRRCGCRRPMQQAQATPAAVLGLRTPGAECSPQLLRLQAALYRRCIATTIRCAGPAAISTTPSASNPRISPAAWRWSLARA